MPRQKKDQSIVIIGAGPSGLGCAYELCRIKNHNFSITVFDKNEIVGGLARTHEYEGFYFDVGPHRFFTKNEEVLKLWKEILGPEFIEVPRLTRILYQNKLFLYPIEIKDVLKKLGFRESAESLLSYFQAKIFLRKMDPETFEEWITKNFGKKLYSVFFKTYTEKVWGIPCNEIGAEWAAQRIKNLNFIEVVRNAILGSGKSKAKSLVDKFYYPVKGAGYLYEKMTKDIVSKRHVVQLDTKVSKIKHNNGKIVSLTTVKNQRETEVSLDYLFSSMPLTHFIFALDPQPPANILKAAQKLYYRDHITVNLIVRKPDLFPDNWIYVHAPDVKMARIANYNNFSRQMQRDINSTAISVEYFVFQDDDIWKLSNDELIKLAVDEMERVDLLSPKDVTGGFVVRETESYPTYYLGHKKYFDALKKYVKGFINLELIGRGGMYKYNNQDHATYSGMLGARNYLSGNKNFDVWQINEDAEYLEEK